MIYVLPDEGWKRTFFCECEQCEQCEQCTGGAGIHNKITVDDIYDLIKNPPPAAIGEGIVYRYQR